VRGHSASPDLPAEKDDPIAPVVHKTLRELVYKNLRGAVARGAYVPGQALTVRSLAQSMNVSPTPVREALQMLASEGALTVEPNKAYRIPVITRDRMAELREIRAALEGLAAERAAERITLAELAGLEAADARSIRAIARKDTKTYLAANEEFHFILYDAARSPTLSRIILSLWLQIGPSLNLLFRDIKLIEELADNHKRAIAAMRTGDAVAAREAIRRDVLTAGAFIQQHLPDDENADGRAASGNGRVREVRRGS
jgi:DNA-binding GntR family transcriptional regulator